MDEIKLPDDMRDLLRASWHRYLDQLQPLRPQLHAYCRRLTRDLWDAEDLVQESPLKAFGMLGRIENPIRNISPLDTPTNGKRPGVTSVNDVVRSGRVTCIATASLPPQLTPIR